MHLYTKDMDKYIRRGIRKGNRRHNRLRTICRNLAAQWKANFGKERSFWSIQRHIEKRADLIELVVFRPVRRPGIKTESASETVSEPEPNSESESESEPDTVPSLPAAAAVSAGILTDPLPLPAAAAVSVGVQTDPLPRQLAAEWKCRFSGPCNELVREHRQNLMLHWGSVSGVTVNDNESRVQLIDERLPAAANIDETAWHVAGLTPMQRFERLFVPLLEPLESVELISVPEAVKWYCKIWQRCFEYATVYEPTTLGQLSTFLGNLATHPQHFQSPPSAHSDQYKFIDYVWRVLSMAAMSWMMVNDGPRHAVSWVLIRTRDRIQDVTESLLKVDLSQKSVAGFMECWVLLTKLYAQDTTETQRVQTRSTLAQWEWYLDKPVFALATEELTEYKADLVANLKLLERYYGQFSVCSTDFRCYQTDAFTELMRCAKKMEKRIAYVSICIEQREFLGK